MISTLVSGDSIAYKVKRDRICIFALAQDDTGLYV